MKKLTEQQIALAKELLKKHAEEKQVFVKVSTGHMYFKKESALLSVGNDVKDLLKVEPDGSVSEVTEEAAKAEGKEVSLTPDETWKYADLIAHAEKLGIAIDKNVDKSKVSVLAKINAASNPGA